MKSGEACPPPSSSAEASFVRREDLLNPDLMSAVILLLAGGLVFLILLLIIVIALTTNIRVALKTTVANSAMAASRVDVAAFQINVSAGRMELTRDRLFTTTTVELACYSA